MNSELITTYIKSNSNGKQKPVYGSKIASDLGISGITVRQLVNEA